MVPKERFASYTADDFDEQRAVQRTSGRVSAIDPVLAGLAHAAGVADRYGMARPVPADAPPSGAKGRLTAVRALFGPGVRVATPLLWFASFCGLLLVYGVSTWLPQMMRATGYGLTSSVSFLLVINAGGIAGMFLAGRIADRFGPATVAALWFLLTAAGALLLGRHLPLGLTYAVVALTGIWLFTSSPRLTSRFST